MFKPCILPICHTPKHEQWKSTLDVLRCQKDAGLENESQQGKCDGRLWSSVNLTRLGRRIIRGGIDFITLVCKHVFGAVFPTANG